MDAEREQELPLESERTIPVEKTGVMALSLDELRQKFHLESCDDLTAYSSLRTIGLGGIGAVFSAHEAGLEREIAIKMLRLKYRSNPDRIEDVIREARITAHIDHPNVVPVYRLGFSREEGVYFSMRRVVGRDLRTILKGVAADEPGYRKRFTLRRRLQIFIEVCNGINFAHNNGILHCDLKPSNLMVGDYGEVQIMDWGMAQLQPELPRRPETPEEPPPPGPQVLAGTPAYLAPERILGFEKEPTILSDVYSLGVILYSILAGSIDLYPPELTPEEVMRRVASGRLPPVRRAARKQGFVVPRELEAICDKAMARNPDQRYQSVGELLQEVHNYLDGYPVKAYRPMPGYRLRKLVARRPLVPCTLLAAVLTWFGFQFYASVEQSSHEKSVLEIAEMAFRRGENCALQLKKQLSTYGVINQERSRDAQETLTSRISLQLSELHKNFSAAFEVLSQLPEHSASFRNGIHSAARMIRIVCQLYFETEDEVLLEELNSLKKANPRLFRQALETTELRETVERLLEHPQGILSLRLSSSLKGAELQLFQEEDGRLLPVAGIDPAEGKTVLAPGKYLLCYTAPGGMQRRTPLRIAAGRETLLELELPPQIPESFILVPAGSYYFRARRERLNLNRRFLPGFLIGRGEVTVGEYRQFWEQLPAARQKAWMPHGSGGKSLWDARGKILPPCRADLPVTGIPFAAAEAYAKWFGRRYGLTGRLPTYQEWLKAARGIDHRFFPWGRDYKSGAAFLLDHPERARYPAGAPVERAGQDCSPYGVCHLSGNVREWVRSAVASGQFKTAAGGSYLSGFELGRIEDVSFIDGWARDVGFRCLLELPKKNAKKVEKSHGKDQ